MHEATLNVDPLRESARQLKQDLSTFSERLETTRERIEGAVRLHHLFGLQLKEDDVLQEMQRLAEKIGKPDLIERFKQNLNAMGVVHSKLDMKRLFTTSTPERPQKLLVKSVSAQHQHQQHQQQQQQQQAKQHRSVSVAQNCNCWIQSNHDADSGCPANRPSLPTGKPTSGLLVTGALPHLAEESRRDNNSSIGAPNCSETDKVVPQAYQSHRIEAANNADEDEEDHSKMADSGLGGCDRCEGNDSNLKRACSCQSFEDATLACAKSNDSDDLGEEEEDCFNDQKPIEMPVSFQPNSHLFSHSSNLNLFDLDDVHGVDQKAQKLVDRDTLSRE